MNFSYNNIKFRRQEEGLGLVMTGEIVNIAITVNGFYAGQTKTFERQVGELEYKVLPEITRYEIYPESAY